MNIELLKAGSLIMVIGMGFVFFFIWIMIYAMEISSKIVTFLGKFFPEEKEDDKYTPARKTITNDEEIALAIACAYTQRH